MLFGRYRSALEQFRFVLKPALAFDIWTTLIFMVSLVPASGWLLNRLVAASGQFAVSDNDLLAFFLSFRGIFFLILSISFILAFWFAEQVGLLIICINAVIKKQISVSRVLLEQMTRLPALIHLGLIQAACYLGASIPFLSGIGLVYWLLLREWDLYYYINVQPASWWIALIIAGAISAAYLLLAAWLYVRWLFSIPILVCEGATPYSALRKSWRQTRGRFWELAVPLAVWWAIILISSATMTWLVRSAAAQLLDHLGSTMKIVVPVAVGTLALMTILDLIWLISGKIVHVMMMTEFYRQTADETPMLSESAPPVRKLSPANVKRIGWGITGVALIAGVVVGAAFVQDLNIQRTVDITGHRGSKVRAPENTLSALRQAINEGADFAEIDVQTTADGVVVLFHDADFMRVASVNRRLRDINYHELKEIDVGSWFAPEFKSERIPTLQEAIDLARGRIKLNIELKFTWPDPALTQKVANIIRQNDFAADCVVSSLNFQAVTEMKAAIPKLVTGFIVFQVAGNLPRMEADFMSINAARAAPRLVRRLHRNGRAVHVWTVNDFNNVVSMIEVGVDNIITDYPRDVRRYLETWNTLSGGEKIVMMLRKLIVGLEGPEPSEL